MKPNYVNQRTLFIDSLYAQLKKEAAKVKVEYNKHASITNEYIESGVKLLGNEELLNNLNEYARQNMGSKTASHSIILAVKR